MTRRVLISGSVAFDTIMVFGGHFKDHILPERVHQLNVSFLVPDMKREPGGCAANIAYTMRLLGGEPAILAAVGDDGVDYRAKLEAMGVDVRQVLVKNGQFTPQGFCVTDTSANQLWAFHPGSMDDAWQARAEELSPAAWGIVAPNSKRAMVDHAQAFADMKLPFVFDPGQGLPLMNGDDLRRFVGQASAVAVNDYESGIVQERTGWTEAQLAEQAGTLLVTLGADGSKLYHDGQVTQIAPVKARKVVDPTGCGDAYRGALLYGLAQGWDWRKSAQLGSVMGAIKIETQGPQNHDPDRDEIAERYAQSYGERPWP